MTTSIYASDQSLLHLAVEQEIADADSADSELQIVRELVQALDVFAGSWVAPLSLGFQVVYRDPSNYFEEAGRPAQPNYMLRQEVVPADVSIGPAFSGSHTERVTTIDAASVENALLRALNQSAPPSRIVSFSQLEWTAVRALSPDLEPSMLDVGGHPSTPISEKKDGKLWYFGPSGIAGPPLRVRATSTHYAMTISVDVFWELWITHARGRALLDAALDRVLARPGWQRGS